MSQVITLRRSDAAETDVGNSWPGSGSVSSITPSTMQIRGAEIVAWRGPTLPITVHDLIAMAGRRIFASELVLVEVQQSPGIRILIERVEELEGLPDNWDGYGAESPNATAIALARDVLDRLHSDALTPERIVPSAEGGVAFVFRAPDRYADIECFNDGSVFAGSSGDTIPTEVWPVGADGTSLGATIERIRTILGK
jgi:hypothetical protein